jgi:hypothetical protein
MIHLLIRFIIPVVLLLLWIYALADAIKVPDDSMYRSGNKLVWVIVILLAPIVGAILYLTIGRPILERPSRRRQTPPDDII